MEKRLFLLNLHDSIFFLSNSIRRALITLFDGFDRISLYRIVMVTKFFKFFRHKKYSRPENFLKFLQNKLNIMLYTSCISLSFGLFSNFEIL